MIAGSIAGSSPLARGLRRGRVPIEWVRRIIPARAGFTHQQRRQTRLGADHPRSRGVYGKSATSERILFGSSPLARGLRYQMSGPQPSSRDHPRSRGVYHAAAGLIRGGGGSSPLARGLPFTIMRSFRRRGIIPARAGFTRIPGGVILRETDHPRSRGVYGGDVVAVRPGQGIIPARAGFTRDYGGGGRAQPGSSPLARGLRVTTLRPGLHDWDHPRSRGVYDGEVGVGTCDVSGHR